MIERLPFDTVFSEQERRRFCFGGGSSDSSSSSSSSSTTNETTSEEDNRAGIETGGATGAVIAATSGANVSAATAGNVTGAGISAGSVGGNLDTTTNLYVLNNIESLGSQALSAENSAIIGEAINQPALLLASLLGEDTASNNPSSTANVESPVAAATSTAPASPSNTAALVVIAGLAVLAFLLTSKD